MEVVLATTEPERAETEKAARKMAGPAEAELEERAPKMLAEMAPKMLAEMERVEEKQPVEVGPEQYAAQEGPEQLVAQKIGSAPDPVYGR